MLNTALQRLKSVLSTAHRQGIVLVTVCAVAITATTFAVVEDDKRRTEEQRAAAIADAAWRLERDQTAFYLEALTRLQPIGHAVANDARAWAESGSPLLTAQDVSSLQSTADAVSSALTTPPTPKAPSADLLRLFELQSAVISGAHLRFADFSTNAIAVARSKADAASMADSSAKQAVADASAALESAVAQQQASAAALARLTSTVAAAEASHAANVAAAEAAAAAARRGSVVRRADEPSCASDVFTCVNQIRAFYGLRTLTLSSSLNATAQHCANTLAAPGAPFQHSPLTPGVRGENIARGYGSSVSVFNAWMSSSGHRANILNNNWRYMGLGFASPGNNWCQQFS